MNKQIELVERWLADNDSVSQAQLEANVADADAVYAAYAAAIAAADAAYADGDHAAKAAEWVAKYHELVEEKRQ